MRIPLTWDHSDVLRSLVWIIGISLSLGLPYSAGRAQEFDFTPTPSGSAPVPDPDGVPPVPSIPETLPQPASPETKSVPTMPLLPQAQSSGDLPTVALPATAIPAVPSTTPATASYSRQPNITPGVPQGGTHPGKLREGTTLPLTVYRPFTFQPYQAINSNLEISDPVTDDQGRVVIPAGSVVWGSFVPVIEQENVEAENGDLKIEEDLVGNRFVANRLTIGSKTYLLQGNSEILPTRFDPDADLGTVAVRGAGYGAIGGLALGVLTGGVGLIPVVAGSAVGAAAGTTTVDQVVTLAPNTVIPVTLTADLILR